MPMWRDICQSVETSVYIFRDISVCLCGYNCMSVKTHASVHGYVCLSMYAWLCQRCLCVPVYVVLNGVYMHAS